MSKIKTNNTMGSTERYIQTDDEMEKEEPQGVSVNEGLLLIHEVFLMYY